MLMLAALIILAILCPAWLLLGLLIGQASQYRAQRSMPPLVTFTRKPKIETFDEDANALDEKLEAATQMAADLEKLSVEELKDRAEFYNVRWDERPSERQRVEREIIRAYINPGAYRA